MPAIAATTEFTLPASSGLRPTDSKQAVNLISLVLMFFFMFVKVSKYIRN